MVEVICRYDDTPLREARDSYTTRREEGGSIELSDVPGWRCPECGQFFASGEGIRVRLAEEEVTEVGLEPGEIPILMILAADTPNKTVEGSVRSQTVFHRMLYRTWQELGCPDDLFGRFDAGSLGPVYESFEEYETHLEEKGLLSVSAFIPKVDTTRYRVTDEGLQIGRKLLDIMPEEWSRVIHKVKDREYYKSAEQIAEETLDPTAEGYPSA